MKASFIIPLYNCLSLTQAMLASLRATLPPGLAGEIIFVDDGSTDGTRAWLAGLAAPCRAILHESNRGFAAACNRGAADAGGDVLFFLNNDLVLTPRWLEPMQAVLARAPAAGLVGNVQLNATTGAVDHAGIYFTHQGKPAHITALPPGHRAWPVAARREVAALTGACFAVRRAVWRELGGFDEGFVNGGEDIDLCLRAAAAGQRHYVALRSIVRHHVSASTGRKLRDEHNTWRLVRRWRDPIARLAARDWCRHFIATHWDQSFVYDDALGRAAFYYLLHLRRTPAPAVMHGIRRAILRECDRWAGLPEAQA